MGGKRPHRTKSAQSPVEAAVRELAGRQSGNVTRRQLLTLGLSAEAINARRRNGSLVTRHTGVYCVAPPRQDAQALIAAAVLAGGTGDRRPRHILTHRCPSLQPRDVTRQRDVLTTTPARTALDLAPRLARKELTRLVNDGRISGLLELGALADGLERNPLHPGTKLLRRFVEHPTSPTRSWFEDAFPAFAEKYGLPPYELNAWINGREVDVYFRAQRVIVELDGRHYHMDEDAFEDDRERDTDHLDHDLITVRITKRRFDGAPDYEAARLLRILSGRT